MNEPDYDSFKQAMQKIADDFKSLDPSRKIRIISHLDADGITAASILINALQKENRSYTVSIVQQITDIVMEEIAEEDYDLFVFTDIGSGQIEVIKRHLKDNEIFILDHHEMHNDLKQYEGIKHINPKAEVVDNYIGVSGEAWNNPAKAKELALTQYNAGVEVIFVAAGASGAGVFDAAEDKKKLAIGVDSNQNWMKPGFVLTSMLKRVDQAVYSTIEDVKNNKFTTGTIRYGLKDKGVDFALDQHNDKLITADIRTKIEAIKSDIIAGKIIVPDFYLEKNKK